MLRNLALDDHLTSDRVIKVVCEESVNVQVDAAVFTVSIGVREGFMWGSCGVYVGFS